MNKRSKIIGIIISFIIMVVTYVCLIIFEILPNPFLDTTDLICSKVVDTGDFKIIDERIITFDKKANIKLITEKNITEYPNEETAKIAYERITKDQDLTTKIELQGNQLVGEYIEISVENFKGYGKNKKDVKRYYEIEFDYVCGKE